LQNPTLAQDLPASGKPLSPRRVSQLPAPSPVSSLRGTLPSLPPLCMCLGAASGSPAASTLKKGRWFAYPYDPPMTQQVGTAVVSPKFTAVVSPTGQTGSHGITLHSACSTVDVLAPPPMAKPNGAPSMTELPPTELSEGVGVLAVPPAAMAELSAATTPQGSISCASLTSAGTPPISDSSDSNLSNEGLDTSKNSKPLSEKEELAALREGLAELYASIAEQAGDKQCETFLDSPAVLVLERGLFALERVWVSE